MLNQPQYRHNIVTGPLGPMTDPLASNWIESTEDWFFDGLRWIGF